MAAITVSTGKAADGDVRVRVSREDARQFEAFVAAAHHVVSRFEVEEQVVVQPIDRGSGAEGTGDLRNDVRHHFAPVEAGEQPQSEGDRRVEMRAGNGGGQIDGHGDAGPQMMLISHWPKLAPASFSAATQPTPKKISSAVPRNSAMHWPLMSDWWFGS